MPGLGAMGAPVFHDAGPSWDRFKGYDTPLCLGREGGLAEAQVNTPREGSGGRVALNRRGSRRSRKGGRGGEGEGSPQLLL